MSEHLLGDDLTLRSLGIHRVRDFVRRQEIFQLCGDLLPASFPPLNASDVSSSPLAAIAVIDVVGSSEIATAGHDAVVNLAQQWRDTISTAADTHNGANLTAIGDGCIPTFRAPQDAVGFVRAVRERLQTNELQVRGSVHFGPVELVGDDIAGRIVHLAHGGLVIVAIVWAASAITGSLAYVAANPADVEHQLSPAERRRSNDRRGQRRS